jgi:hypothetical protein
MPVHAYIAWAPRGEGLAAALLYGVRDARVLGWLAREHDKHCVAAFFALDGYYGASAVGPAQRARSVPLPAASPAPRASFKRSLTGDIHGRWIEQATPLSSEIACPIDAGDCRWLLRLQSSFIEDWFFRGDEARERDEIAAYAADGLPVRMLNIRSSRLRRFDRHRPVWVHASPAIDFDLVLYLKRRLPQDSHEAQLLP